MKYINIFNINRPSEKTVSAYGYAEDGRMYNEVIIGYNIKPDNIKYKRFDYSVTVCQTPQEVKKTLTKYGVTRTVNSKFKDELRKYMPGV